MRTICFLGCLLSLICSHALFAVEGGLGLWPLGFPASKEGLNPPPGTFVLREDYVHYPAKLKGLAKLHADLDFISFRYVTNLKILGGDYSFGGYLPFGRVSVHQNTVELVPSLQVTPSASGVPQPTVVQTPKIKRVHGVDHGVADCLLVPILIGWHWDTLHTILALEFG